MRLISDAPDPDRVPLIVWFALNTTSKKPPATDGGVNDKLLKVLLPVKDIVTREAGALVKDTLWYVLLPVNEKLAPLVTLI
jgi:hypothetical protein